MTVLGFDDRPLSRRRGDDHSEFRYGVFLRPPAPLASLTTSLFALMRSQFGFTAAAAYPPHVTLVGNVAIDVTEREFLRAVAGAADGIEAVTLQCSGPHVRSTSDIVFSFDVNDGSFGARAIVELVDKLFKVVTPIRVFPVTDRRIATRRLEGAENFAAHLTIVGHDGEDDAAITEEAEDFLRSLRIEVDPSYTFDTVSVYRMRSDDWSNRYWETMNWALLRSFRLASH